MFELMRQLSPRHLLAGVALLCVTSIVVAEPTSQFTITGGVRQRSTVGLTDLEARPAVTQTVTFSAGATPQTHTYVGTSLWGTLDDAGIVVDPTVKNDVLNKYVVATAIDGYRVVLSLGELNPNFGARPDLVAYAERLGSTTTPLGADGFARLTAPGDAKGGRYVSNLANLDVRSAHPAQASVGGGTSSTFAVSGNVTADHVFDLAALMALAPVTQSVGGVAYTGVSLWDLLTSAVGIRTNPAVKNDLLGKYVVATGSDGYSVVFSLGELDPAFGNAPDFIAYLANGSSLGADGFARIIVPDDGRKGRWVSNLVSLEVLSVPEPGSVALLVPGLLMLQARRVRRR